MSRSEIKNTPSRTSAPSKILVALIKEKIKLPLTYSITGDAEEHRNKIALAAGKVKAVTTAAENEKAGECVREMRGLVKRVKTMREDISKPLLEAQRLLKSLADEYCKPLDEEIIRIEGLATTFQMAERRRAEKAEQDRLAELQRIEDERVEAERRAAEALEKAKTPRQIEKAEQLQIKAETVGAAAQSVLALPEVKVNKVRGQTNTRTLKFEVTDIEALCKARPDLVRKEANASAIQALCVPDMPNLPPGLKLWWDERTRF